MQRVMEVYAMHLDAETQLNEMCAMHYEQGPSPPTATTGKRITQIMSSQDGRRHIIVSFIEDDPEQRFVYPSDGFLSESPSVEMIESVARRAEKEPPNWPRGALLPHIRGANGCSN